MIQNTGGGHAHNFSVASAQPKILGNPGLLPVCLFEITGFVVGTCSDGSTFQLQGQPRNQLRRSFSLWHRRGRLLRAAGFAVGVPISSARRQH